VLGRFFACGCPSTRKISGRESSTTSSSQRLFCSEELSTRIGFPSNPVYLFSSRMPRRLGRLHGSASAGPPSGLQESSKPSIAKEAVNASLSWGLWSLWFPSFGQAATPAKRPRSLEERSSGARVPVFSTKENDFSFDRNCRRARLWSASTCWLTWPTTRKYGATPVVGRPLCRHRHPSRTRPTHRPRGRAESFFRSRSRPRAQAAWECRQREWQCEFERLDGPIVLNEHVGQVHSDTFRWQIGAWRLAFGRPYVAPAQSYPKSSSCACPSRRC